MFKSNKREVLEALKQTKKNTLDKIGAVVEAEAKLRTTVDTGTLRRSISFVTDESNNKVSIGSNVEYASYVELGTSRQTEQPFLTPAVEENIDKLKKIAETEYKNLNKKR
jgi:HK97 gp10 family phage protein